MLIQRERAEISTTNIILIVSYISTIVAPSNLSIIASIGMEVYHSLQISKRLLIHIMKHGSFKIIVSHNFVLQRTTFSWENHDFNNAISRDIIVSDVF